MPVGLIACRMGWCFVAESYGILRSPIDSYRILEKNPLDAYRIYKTLSNPMDSFEILSPSLLGCFARIIQQQCISLSMYIYICIYMYIYEYIYIYICIHTCSVINLWPPAKLELENLEARRMQTACRAACI